MPAGTRAQPCYDVSQRKPMLQAICTEASRRNDVTAPPAPTPSPFFSDQLTAFEVWLRLGARASQRPPEQLPILLQVLLSPTHRLRALLLLGRFVALGAWAVGEMLAVGIFPYILKLLLSAASELRPPLLFIWARVRRQPGFALMPNRMGLSAYCATAAGASA